MTKKDIVRIVSEELGLTQQQTKAVVQRTFDAIIEWLANEERIELRNFGVFEVRQRAARTARNPRTNERVEVPGRKVVVFKPGKEMEIMVNQPRSLNQHSPLFPLGWGAKGRTGSSSAGSPE
ncbi:MAG: integration host factor subunit beta [Planctomycetaceae bacterium]|nr:MAG: integration host factor subunit beta [Planctomycetaceae bacterium]